MGASGWAYFTPYQKDVNKAMQELKEQQFDLGKYYTPYAHLPENASFEEFVPKNIVLNDQIKEAFKLEYEKFKQLRTQIPNSIAELLHKNAESGTHSIIDINEISETDEYHSSGKISDENLLSIFKTLKPNRSQVEKKQYDLQTYRGRWLCTYIVIYENEEPAEFFFTGYSGD